MRDWFQKLSKIDLYTQGNKHFMICQTTLTRYMYQKLKPECGELVRNMVPRHLCHLDTTNYTDRWLLTTKNSTLRVVDCSEHAQYSISGQKGPSGCLGQVDFHTFHSDP